MNQSGYTRLDQCWSTIYDAGPTLVQHCVDVSYLLGSILTDIAQRVRTPVWVTHLLNMSHKINEDTKPCNMQATDFRLSCQKCK